MPFAFRHYSFLFVICVFISLMMSGGSAIGVRAHVAELHDMTQSPATFVDTESQGRQRIVARDYSCGVCVADDDFDEELLLPSPLRMTLAYFPSAAPLNAGVSLYSLSAAPLLQPPNLT